MVLAVMLFSFIMILNFSIRSILMSDIDKRLEYVSGHYYTFILESLVPRTTVVTDLSGKRQIIITNKLGYTAPPPPPQFSISDNSQIPLRKRVYIRGIYYSPSGEILHTQDQNLIGQPPLDPAGFLKARTGYELYTYAVHKSRKYRILYHPVILDGTLLGIIQSTMPVDEYETLIETINIILISFIPLALVVAGASGLILTKKMLEPVRQMATAADTISVTDLSRRLPLSGYDEFAKLGGTINHMLGRLENSFDELKEAFNREQQFTSDASHELRTPLTAIKAGSSLALRHDRDSAYYKKTLSEIEQSADYMNTMISNLLNIARSENGGITLNCSEVDGSKLCEEAVAMVKEIRGNKTININISEKGLKFVGDYDQLKRLLVNLLENSIRHTNKKGCITLKAQKENQSVILTVTDNGEGILPEHLPYLTQRFYRADKSRDRKIGGTGLGLAICKSIAQLHKGTISIKSSPGEGTEVTVTFPTDLADFCIKHKPADDQME